MSKLVQQIPPAKALINGIRAIGYSFSTSVADIIDNSIAAKAKNINIFSSHDNEIFIVAFKELLNKNFSRIIRKTVIY